MPIIDKGLLRKRFIIETVFDKLKTSMGLEHSRHRAPANAFVHILSCIAAYMLGKIKVKMGPVTVTKTNQADRRSSIALIQNSGSDAVLCRGHVVDLDALTKFHIFVILVAPWFCVSLGEVAAALLVSRTCAGDQSLRVEK